MDLKKNDIFTVAIEDMSDDGAGIGRQDGYIWFIKDTVIGDRVEARVMKMKKSYGFARLVKVTVPSPARSEPLCSVARQCGGCQLQAMNYEEQLKFKENKVYNNLLRIGKLDGLPRVTEDVCRAGEEPEGFLPIMGMENPWRYRNKAQFPFKIIIEFMEEHHVKAYDEKFHQGLVRHVLIRKGFRTGRLMVCLVINGRELPCQDKLAKRLERVEGMTSISLCVNMEKTNVIMGEEVISLFGPGYIEDYIGDIKYQISPLSFYQVNPAQTEKLYRTALEYAGLTGEETVWDLYCGIGTISLFLAQKAKRVYGVEVVPQAIGDARKNAALNGMSNVEFFVGRAEEVLPEAYERNQIHADVIVVDPPRKGCDEKCLETIVKMAPERVVYVSCDSATLARDLKYLCGRGYEVRKVRCCDMFPATVHVETVVLIQRKDT